MDISIILVPQGAEYQAVCQGIKRSDRLESQPLVIPIPLGSVPLSNYLKQPQFAELLARYEHPKIVLMGVCGSLQKSLDIGDTVVYEECIYQSIDSDSPSIEICDVELTALLLSRCLSSQVNLVKALTSDRLVRTAREKFQLGQKYNADVVDMEGFTALKMLKQAQCQVAMLRVVSDGCDRDLPDISKSFQSDGSIQPLTLAVAMLRQPLAAIDLVTGSLKALNVLRDLASKICT